MPYDSPGSRIKSLQKQDSTPEGKYRRWVDEITQMNKEFSDWWERGDKIVKRFKDERDAMESTIRKFNIFSTNVGIMQSALYAQLPKVKVSRRFGQPDDDAARVAALIIENSINQDMEENECDFDQTLRDAIEDRLVPGMGCAWLRLITETEENRLEAVLDPLSGQEIQPAITYEVISKQEVVIEHVYWKDFCFSPCRSWKERRWVGRRVYMDYDSLVDRFGKEKAGDIPLDYNPRASSSPNTPSNTILQKAIIYEIWDRENKEVVWFAKGMSALLDERTDPLQLEGFDPCPKPLFALTTTSNCIPRADFSMLQDQYNEMDLVNNRISMLVQACKVVGVYDTSAKGIARMLQEGVDNTLIPVDNWSMFAEKGGIKGQIDFLPLDMVIAALQRLREAREDIKGQIYELTGISDIVRGNTKASETLGAQQLKAQFASIRIQKQQEEVARFAQDILRIKGEIICRHFIPEQILKLAGMEFYPQDQPLTQQAMQLIKSPDHEDFDWRIKIEADSLAMVDYAQQKQERIEFTNAVATFFQSAATALQNTPILAPMMFASLKFIVAGFKGSSELEGVVDSTIQQMQQQAQQPKPPPPPPPEVIKAQAETEAIKQKTQLEGQAKQQDMQFKAQEHQMNMQFKAQENQQALEQKGQAALLDADLKARKMVMDQANKAAEAEKKE